MKQHENPTPPNKKRKKFGFPRSEHLKSESTIQQLFSRRGVSVAVFPIRALWLPLPPAPLPAVQFKAGFSVPKKSFPRAVHRNRLKRQMRESYRLHKSILERQPHAIAVMFLYTAKEPLDFVEIERAFVKLLSKMESHLRASKPTP